MFAACWPLSYLTFSLFKESNTVAVTKAVGIIFVLSGCQVVPMALLRKNMQFKTIAIIEVISVLISSSLMLVIAKAGGGVWSLAGGRISVSFSKALLVTLYGGWRPSWWLRLKDVRSYFAFGLSMTFARSTFYLWEKSDRYFAGLFWKTSNLGLYTFALQLAQMPTEKIVTLINQVLYSGMAQVKDDPVSFNKLYLSSTRYTAIVVIPLFTIGYLFSSELITVFLNPKWLPITSLFSYLCLGQILLALNASNNFVHAALGRPYFGLIFHVVCLALMPLSFRIAAPYGYNAYAYPWLITYSLISVAWIIITLKTIKVPLLQYLSSVRSAIACSLVMVMVVKLSKISQATFISGLSVTTGLCVNLAIALVVYATLLLSLEKDFCKNIAALRR